MKFDANVNAQYTPFHNVRAGLWNANMICERLMDEMYDSSAGLKDPRANFYFDKLVGVPTQVTYNELMGYYDTAGHYRRNVIQDRDHFALMNYSELWFIWAEAAYRGWIPGTPKEYYVKAVSEAVCEWTDDASADLTPFLSNPKVSIDALDGEEVLERIMTQKWISNFLVGIESWCDYRRTGYPEMPVKAWLPTTASAHAPALSFGRGVPQPGQLFRGGERLARRHEQHDHERLVGRSYQQTQIKGDQRHEKIHFSDICSGDGRFRSLFVRRGNVGVSR